MEVIIKNLIMVILSFYIGITVKEFLVKKKSLININDMIENGKKLYPKKNEGEVIQTLFFFCNQLSILLPSGNMNNEISKLRIIFKDKCKELGIDYKGIKKDEKNIRLDSKQRRYENRSRF